MFLIPPIVLITFNFGFLQAPPEALTESWPSGAIRTRTDVRATDDRGVIPHGVRTSWHENGVIESLTNFVNGKMQGEYKEWFDNGQLHALGAYADGWYDGTWTWFHSNGQIALTATYRHGMGYGHWVYQDERGIVEHEMWFADDNSYRDVGYFEDGRLHYEKHWAEGWKMDGPTTWWHPNGQVALYSTYQMNEPVSEWVWYDNTGKEINRRTFANRPPTPDTEIQTALPNTAESVDDK